MFDFMTHVLPKIDFSMDLPRRISILNKMGVDERKFQIDESKLMIQWLYILSSIIENILKTMIFFF